MPEFCGCCHNSFMATPTIVRVSCWGCRQDYHEQCLRMSEPEVRIFRERRIWWCPPCSQERAMRGLKLDDPPVKLYKNTTGKMHRKGQEKGKGRPQEREKQDDANKGRNHDRNSNNKQMGLDLYYTPGSSPCRSVLLAAKAVGVELNLKQLDLMKGEHLKPEFLKINPQHNVPTLDDNGFAINESRAIIVYLVEKYGKDDSLYPKDVKKRALVNQRLFFDIGTLYQRFGDLYYPVMFGGAPFDDEKKKKLDEAYGFLDKYLEDGKWAAGDNYTLADIALAASVSSAEVVGYDISKYPHVAKWLAKAKSTLPGYAEANEKGVQMFKGMYEALTKKA